MIIMALCNSCFQPFNINMQPQDTHLVRQIADESLSSCPCPRLCGGKINLVDIPEFKNSKALKTPMSLTSKELYQAVNGLGLPDEIPKDKLVLESLLRANAVNSALVEEHGGRVYLHELELTNGVVIHLSSGSRGAMVVKITKEARDGSHS